MGLGDDDPEGSDDKVGVSGFDEILGRLGLPLGLGEDNDDDRAWIEDVLVAATRGGVAGDSLRGEKDDLVADGLIGGDFVDNALRVVPLIEASFF